MTQPYRYVYNRLHGQGPLGGRARQWSERRLPAVGRQPVPSTGQKIVVPAHSQSGL